MQNYCIALRYLIQLTIFAVLITTLTGCCDKKNLFPSPPEINSSEELGSVQITLHKPFPYEKYKTTLQPTFELTEQEALQQAIAMSAEMSAHHGSHSKTQAEINLATSGFEQTISKETVDGDTTEKSKSTETKKSGEIPSITRNDATLSPANWTEPKQEIKTDATLLHQTAKSLYQAVKLMNHEYENFDYGDKYVSYITTLQITTMPKVRNAPYDAFVDINFAIEDNNSVQPIIVPLLVTDSMEKRSSQLSVEQFKELSVGLKGMINGIGIGGGYQDADKLIKMVIGHDYNSLLTVGRIGNSTLRVRIGAMQQASSDYAMINRNYMVTVVIIVPKTALKKQDTSVSRLSASTLVKFINSTDGKTLPSKYASPTINRKEIVKHIFTDYNIADELDEKYPKIIRAINSRSFEDFLRIIHPDNMYHATNVTVNFNETKSIVPIDLSASSDDNETHVLHYRIIWLKLLNALSDTGDDFQTVPLVDYEPKKLEFENQWIKQSDVIYMLDKGKDQKAMVSLMPVGNARSDKVAARVYFKNSLGREMALQANTIEHNAKNHQLTLYFDSLSDWGIEANNSQPLKLELIDYANGIEPYTFTSVQYRLKPDAIKHDIKLVNKNGNDKIIVQNGETNATVRFQVIGKAGKDNPCMLIVKNARIKKNWSHKALLLMDKDNEKYQIIGEGIVDLELENLEDTSKIEIYGSSKNNSQTDSLMYTVKVQSTR